MRDFPTRGVRRHRYGRALPPIDKIATSAEPITTPTEIIVLVVFGGATVAASTATSYVAPILAFVGAVLVAAVAAVTAGRRQRQALAAEGLRHQQSLQAENSRHDAQLAHARELADLADLRSLLDNAASALHEGRYAKDGLRVAFIQYGRKLDEFDPEVRTALNKAGTELDALAARLRVRLGTTDPIVTAFEAANEALLMMSRETGLLEDLDAGAVKTTRSAIEGASASFDAGSNDFFEAAVTQAGARFGPGAVALDQKTTGEAEPSRS